MSKRLTLLATVAALAITPALAQQPSTPSTQESAPQAQQSTQPSEKFVSAQSTDEWMGSDVIGMRVRGGGDENIGSISDLLIDKDGNVKAAVIGVGGFLGIGQKNVAVSFDSLNIQRNAEGNQEARLALSKEELEGAPDFKEYEPPRATGGSGSSGSGTSKPGGL